MNTQTTLEMQSETDQEVRCLASVVIPAHDEADVLGRCLDALTRGLEPGEVEIIVVCNGCKDATAEVARTYDAWVTTIETDVASKANALNRGDAAATAFPRFYLDADVVMPSEALRRCVRRLAQSDVLATSPRLELDFRECSWPVRAFYRVWARLPYCRDELLGCGVYALTREGRAKFDVFPDVLADDVYISLVVGRDQRRVTHDAWFRITPPANMAALVRVRARHQRSGYQMRKRYAALYQDTHRDYRSAALSLAMTPSLWIDAFFYVAVFTATRLAGWRQYAFRKNPMTWERDETSRREVLAPVLPPGKDLARDDTHKGPVRNERWIRESGARHRLGA